MSARGSTLALAVLLSAAASPECQGQTPGVWLRVGDSTAVALQVVMDEGYAALPAEDLALLGWSVAPRGDTVDLVPARDGMDPVRFVIGTPFIWWDEDVLQMTNPPYWLDENYYVPAQLILDFLPKRVATVDYDPLTRTLSTGAEESGIVDGPTQEAGEVEPPWSVKRERRVVVIDPGHGGRDPGTTGANGVREKDVALALGLALFAELAGDSTLEVHLTRDTDVLIPIWRRGEQATQLKSDRPGVFISLHANALPGSAATRGFETYVLSEARTDHERRVAALENGDARDAVATEPGAGAGELDLILRELQNLGYQTWSVLLAELVQQELVPVHSGRDRGVNQAPLAVLTNALMPAVLVEIGYLTNRRDESLLRRPDFHLDAARAMALAVRTFFERYPPGERRTIPDER